MSLNGQVITVTGFWFDGFEIAVIAERLDPDDFAHGNVKPGGIEIWATGLPSDVSGSLLIQPNNPTGYPAHYGKVEIAGVFSYGDRYGHMGAYPYQIEIKTAKLLEWNPPQ